MIEFRECQSMPVTVEGTRISFIVSVPGKKGKKREEYQVAPQRGPQATLEKRFAEVMEGELLAFPDEMKLGVRKGNVVWLFPCHAINLFPRLREREKEEV